MTPEHLACPCTMAWLSITPRPVCPHHGRVFQEPIYFSRVIPFDLDAYFEEFKAANPAPAPEVM